MKQAGPRAREWSVRRSRKCHLTCDRYWKFLRGRMSVAQFRQIYSMRFDILDHEEIASLYDGKILTSWEGYEDRGKTILKFSHRHLIAEWLRKHGHEVMELDPMPRKRRVL